jgi:hypothetical protein
MVERWADEGDQCVVILGTFVLGKVDDNSAEESDLRLLSSASDPVTGLEKSGVNYIDFLHCKLP